jgi:hypothetical protein
MSAEVHEMLILSTAHLSDLGPDFHSKARGPQGHLSVKPGRKFRERNCSPDARFAMRVRSLS